LFISKFDLDHHRSAAKTLVNKIRLNINIKYICDKKKR